MPDLPQFLQSWQQSLRQHLDIWLENLQLSGGSISFEWPIVLLLLPLPLAVRMLPPARNWRAALQVYFFASLQTLSAGNKMHAGNPLLSGGMWLIWLLLLCSAARPIWLGEAIPLSTEGREIMLAVDISGSMETRDMMLGKQRVPRIAAVKQVVRDFIERRTGDRMGLILFGSRPYLQMPLSFDLYTMKTLLMEAQLGFAGKSTAIGDAIALAVKRLRDRPAQNRVLILLTDGSNTAGDFEPLQAARLAAAEDVRIHTIGIGADRVPYYGFSRSLVRNRELDEKALRNIAQIGGGKYFRARNPEDLKKIYSELDQLEPLPQEEELFRPQRSLYHWPLATALLLSVLFALRVFASYVRKLATKFHRAVFAPPSSEDRIDRSGVRQNSGR